MDLFVRLWIHFVCKEMVRFYCAEEKKHCEHAIINEGSVVKAERTANLHQGWKKIAKKILWPRRFVIKTFKNIQQFVRYVKWQ